MQPSHFQKCDWDSTASEYSKLPKDGPLLVPCKRLLGAMHGTLSFASATTIIDIGCGPGTAVSFLIDDYGHDIPPQSRVIATDYSTGMVEVTRSRVETERTSGKKNAKCWGQVETMELDAQDLSAFPSSSASHIMGSLVYFMLPDPQKGLREAYRVLRAGGVFACTSWARVQWMQFMDQAAQEVRRAAGSESHSTGMRFFPKQWGDVAGVKGELESAGFRDVHSEYIDFDWLVEDPEAFAETMCKSSNPGTKMLLGDLSDEKLDRVVESYTRIVKEHGNVCKGVAVLGIGTK
ncbi:S-adenosyl-L-methionine-dependent methyltransferase [Aspergillus alliaceus]|uniref:S-adenosyl-L-methionine-dependent methyltransferase n=1 Tax=Petromyces alliaceus TaxID=209559 RepID=A0A5N7CEG4_PETAA|nr:S-adenosyl-L-methionine-dependent methyltransferase [Aspergillus alliaceus]